MRECTGGINPGRQAPFQYWSDKQIMPTFPERHKWSISFYKGEKRLCPPHPTYLSSMERLKLINMSQQPKWCAVTGITNVCCCFFFFFFFYSALTKGSALSAKHSAWHRASAGWMFTGLMGTASNSNTQLLYTYNRNLGEQPIDLFTLT